MLVTHVNNSSLRYQYQDHERKENMEANSNLDWTTGRVFLPIPKRPKGFFVSKHNGPKPHLYISREKSCGFHACCTGKKFMPVPGAGRI